MWTVDCNYGLRIPLRYRRVGLIYNEKSKHDGNSLFDYRAAAEMCLLCVYFESE